MQYEAVKLILLYSLISLSKSINENNTQIILNSSNLSNETTPLTNTTENQGEDYVTFAKSLLDKLSITKSEPTSREVLGVFLKGMIIRMKETNEVELAFYNLVIEKALTKIPEVVQGHEIQKYTSAEFLQDVFNEVIEELGEHNFNNETQTDDLEAELDSLENFKDDL